MKKNAVVVGAGINGLVASNYLQKNNFDVTLIEKNNYIGGACIEDTIEYKILFSFLLTMAEIFAIDKLEN